MTELAEHGSLEYKMNSAVLRMNSKLREEGYSERERAFLWGMTVVELREFLTLIWDHLHSEKTDLPESSQRMQDRQSAQIDNPPKPGPPKAIRAQDD